MSVPELVSLNSVPAATTSPAVPETLSVQVCPHTVPADWFAPSTVIAWAGATTLSDGRRDEAANPRPENSPIWAVSQMSAIFLEGLNSVRFAETRLVRTAWGMMAQRSPIVMLRSSRRAPAFTKLSRRDVPVAGVPTAPMT